MSVWFVGYTPSMATAAMVAGANSLGHWISLNGQSIGGSYVNSAFGSTVAGPIWGQAMGAIAALDFPIRISRPPPATRSRACSPPVPDVAGMSAEHATTLLTDAGFRVSVGEPVDSKLVAEMIAIPHPPPALGSAVAATPSSFTHQPGPAPKSGRARVTGQPLGTIWDHD